MRIALVVLALAGCAASTAPNATADKAPPAAPGSEGPVQTADSYRAGIEANETPFRVPGNVTAHLNEEVQIGDLRVKPLAVLEDSRCPQNANCIWAGRVRLRVAISGAGEQEMESNRPLPVPGGRRLTLVGVAPLNWAPPLPAGIDPNAPKRFAFQLSGMD